MRCPSRVWIVGCRVRLWHRASDWHFDTTNYEQRYSSNRWQWKRQINEMQNMFVLLQVWDSPFYVNRVGKYDKKSMLRWRKDFFVLKYCMYVNTNQFTLHKKCKSHISLLFPYAYFLVLSFYSNCPIRAVDKPQCICFQYRHRDLNEFEFEKKTRMNNYAFAI